MSSELARIHPAEMAARANARASISADTRLAIQPRSFDELFRFAETIAKTSFAPSNRPEEVFAMVAAGIELGLTAMQSLKAYHMIQGKPSLSAYGMVAVILASGLCEKWDVIESTPKRATIVTRRRGTGRDVSKTWTDEDARRAQLTTVMWTKYPAQMLRHRCAADLARQEYSDVILGNYTADELSDGAVMVGDEPHAERRSPAPFVPLTALDDLRENLELCTCLGDVVSDWHLISQRLNNDGTSDEGTRLVATWLDDHRHCLTGSEQQKLLAKNYPAAMLAILDALSGQRRGADVIAWYRDADIAASIAALPEHHAKALKLVVARTWCVRSEVETTRPNAAFAEALKSAPAPVSAVVETPVFVTSKGDRLDTADDVEGHIAKISAVAHLESTARKHGAHPWAMGPLADVAEKLLRTADHAEAVAWVAKMAAEGPKAPQSQREAD